MKVWAAPVEFKQTPGKWHVQWWHGVDKAMCGAHVVFEDGRIQYSGNTAVATMHPICCKNCAKKFWKEAS